MSQRAYECLHWFFNGNLWHWFLCDADGVGGNGGDDSGDDDGDDGGDDDGDGDSVGVGVGDDGGDCGDEDGDAGSATIAMAAVQRCDHRHDTHTPQAMPSRKVDEIYATPRVA